MIPGRLACIVYKKHSILCCKEVSNHYTISVFLLLSSYAYSFSSSTHPTGYTVSRISRILCVYAHEWDSHTSIRRIRVPVRGYALTRRLSSIVLLRTYFWYTHRCSGCAVLTSLRWRECDYRDRSIWCSHRTRICEDPKERHREKRDTYSHTLSWSL